MSAVHIYRMLQVVELTTPLGGELMNYPVNRTDFTITRYVHNEIEFWVKNIDRKPVSLDGQTAAIHLTEVETNQVVLTRNLTVLDATKGLVRLTITANEAAAFPLGKLNYGVVLTRADATKVMLCTDRERNGIGNVEVVTGPIPAAADPIEMTIDDFTTSGGKLYSGSFPGSAMVHNTSGQHSALVSLVDFTGDFIVEGSLQPSPGSGDWFVVASTSLNDQSGILHVPFEGNLMRVRFVVETTTGAFSGVTYRN